MTGSIAFPMWSLIIFPHFWVFLLPLYFVIDSLLLALSMSVAKMPRRGEIYKKSIIQFWMIGFLCDAIASALLSIPGWFIAGQNLHNALGQSLDYINVNVFHSSLAFFTMLFAVLINAALAFQLHKRITFRRFRDLPEISRVVFWGAVLTAPWAYFLPVGYLP